MIFLRSVSMVAERPAMNMVREAEIRRNVERLLGNIF